DYRRQHHFTSEARELNSSVKPANLASIERAFRSIRANPMTEGCLIHMTSHGTRGRGFYLSRDPPQYLTPAKLAQWVNGACGSAPTVILVSACFSGQFIAEGLKGPNRIILTAAVQDRTSFGCSADTTYTYWDGCLLERLHKSGTWQELY